MVAQWRGGSGGPAQMKIHHIYWSDQKYAIVVRKMGQYHLTVARAEFEYCSWVPVFFDFNNLSTTSSLFGIHLYVGTGKFTDGAVPRILLVCGPILKSATSCLLLQLLEARNLWII